MITPARPCALIRSRQQGIDFGTCEKWDQSALKTLAGDGEHPLDLCGMNRCLESGETKERAQGSQAKIAAASAEALMLFQVIQKCRDQGCIDLLENQP